MENIIEHHPKAACAVCTGITAFILLIVGLAWSVGTIEPNEYGLKYNSISRTFDSSKVYDGGWYVIGPFNSFITFPRTQVNVDYSELPDAQAKPYSARSEKLAFTLSFSFQYELIRDNIPLLYGLFKD